MPAQKTAARAAAALLAALFLALAAVAAEPPAGATLGNADIVGMTRANLSSLDIINRIYASPNSFDLSDQAFMELKAAGVADEVLSAMLAASRAGGAAASNAVSRLAGGRPIQLPALPPIGGSGSGIGTGTGAATSRQGTGGGIPLISLEPPALEGRSGGWSDLGQDLANLPPPPALPAFSAPPGSGMGTPQGQSTQPPAFSVPPALTAPAQPAQPSFRPSPRPATPPAFSSPPSMPPAQAFSAPPPSAPSLPAPSSSALVDPSRLRGLLGDPNPEQRKSAAQALAQMNDTIAINAAEQNLTSSVAPLDGLIYLVGYARLARAADRLGAILSANQSSLNRAAAAAALAEIGPDAASALPALENALSGDADASVRREAARAVARFRAPSSAALLMNACRRDPEVRKAALEAMAEYPETTEFLVGVVGLGADQIAPDEVEAARASLERLTGQNFGLDGAQWAGWFARNGSRTGSGAAVAGLPAPAGAPGQVDITALGILVDPSQIPMAPELAASSAPADGVLRIPGAGLGGGGVPGALSASDFGDAGLSSLAGGGGIAASPSSAGGVGRGRLPTPAGFEEYGDDQMWSGSMPAPGGPGGGMDMAGAPPASPFGQAAAPSVSREAPPVPDNGLRLALPPMAEGAEGGDFGGVPDMYADSFDSPGTLAFPGDTDAFGIGDPMFGDGGGGFDGGMPEEGFAGAFEDSFANAPLPETADSGDSLAEDYGYGDYGDGYGDAEGDFGGDEFAAILREAVGEDAGTPAPGDAAYEDAEDAEYGDSSMSALPPPPPARRGGETYAEEMLAEETSVGESEDAGTVDLLTGVELPPIGEPYSIVTDETEAAAAPAPAASGMVWVRGVGLVEQQGGAAAPSAAPARRRSAAAAPPDALQLAPAPASGPAAGGSAVASIEGAVVGEWRTLDPLPGKEEEPAPPESAAAAAEDAAEADTPVMAADAETVDAAAVAVDSPVETVVEPAPAVPAASGVDGVVLDGEVFEIYEVPEVESVEVLPSDPSGRPSRRLRKQR